jgi:diguanylate cyclase (GGDEF)-like protein
VGSATNGFDKKQAGDPDRHERVRPRPLVHTAEQRRHTLVEVERRAQGGIYVYLPTWLTIAAATGLFASHPAVVAAVSAVCFMIGLARFVLHRHFQALVARHPGWARVSFLTLMLGNGVLLSLLGTAAVYWPPLAPIQYPLILIGAVICASATMAMAMEPAVRFGMPAAIILPFTVGTCLAPAPGHLGMGVLIALFVAHLIKASRHVHDDYWRGVEALALLGQRVGELEVLSTTDPLTRLHNRLHFERRLADEWHHAMRRSEPLTLMIIDLDHFKRINDTRGHAVGDVCLMHVAAALETSLSRATDLVARYGGEEFVVLLPVTEADAAVKVAERLRRAVEGVAVEIGGCRVALSCSIGLATVWPSFHGTPASALALADAALYEAKATGRNRVVSSAKPVDVMSIEALVGVAPVAGGASPGSPVSPSLVPSLAPSLAPSFRPVA